MTRTLVHVLDHIPFIRRSGEDFFLAMAERLQAMGWRTIHVIAGEPCEFFRTRLGELGLPYLVGPFPLTRANAKTLGQQLRAYEPDVLQTTFISPFSIPLQTLKGACGARCLVVNDHSGGQPSQKTGVKRLLARLRGTMVGAQIDHVVALSEYIRRRDVEELYLPAAKVRVIPLGINTERFSPVSREANGTLTIAYAGRLIPEKGVWCLLHAIRDLVREQSLPAFRVLLAGEGKLAGELKQFCDDNELRQVEFVGQISGMPQFLAEADIVVVPSEIDESFGLVVVEAMACGACVIGSDAGAIPELVGPGGLAGLIFHRGDLADLKQNLKMCINDAHCRNRLAAAARNRVMKLFSLSHTVDQYARLYEEIEASLSPRRVAS
ncbi:MAG TPA: glycosyltransferase family 4 protein [Tepidisphaeraceae bacterium]|nr:glycosyltransferase family 4 protein [Tepidisphaeraceae bacterium]